MISLVPGLSPTVITACASLGSIYTQTYTFNCLLSTLLVPRCILQMKILQVKHIGILPFKIRKSSHNNKKNTCLLRSRKKEYTITDIEIHVGSSVLELKPKNVEDPKIFPYFQILTAVRTCPNSRQVIETSPLLAEHTYEGLKRYCQLMQYCSERALLYL